MREAFALQKLLTFFQQKILGVFEILTFENLTKRLLTTSLVLNNRAQIPNIDLEKIRIWASTWLVTYNSDKT